MADFDRGVQYAKDVLLAYSKERAVKELEAYVDSIDDEEFSSDFINGIEYHLDKQR